MKKYIFYLILAIIIGWGSAASAAPAEEAGYLNKALYTKERPQEFWVVNSATKKRSLVQSDSYKALLLGQKSRFAGITEKDFNRVLKKDKDLLERFEGRILLRVERHGAAWGIFSGELYDLSNADSFFKNLKQVATLVSADSLARIHKEGLTESLDQYSSYEHSKVKTEQGTFSVDIIKINLADPDLKIITATADKSDCQKNCAAKSLGDYVVANKAFAALNGTYFCAGGGCGARNYYFFPVYDSATGKLINESQLKYWTTGPIMAFDVNNRFYYFKDSREFGSLDQFEKQAGVPLQAALGNKPRLIEEKKNILIEWEIDAKQRDGKYLRNAIGYKDNGTKGQGEVYLVVVYRATIDNLATVMKQLGMDYALNLDGGASAAMFYNDEYMVGPGRDIPNAILFSKKNGQ